MKANMVMWGLFMSASMRAAVHLGPTYLENMAVFKDMQVEEFTNLFSITQRLLLETSEEIKNVMANGSIDPSWLKANKDLTSTRNQVDKGRSLRARRLSVTFGKNK